MNEIDSRIKLRHNNIGTQKVRCPECQPPHNMNDLPLSVTISSDGYVWLCHHCGFKGGSQNKNKRFFSKPEKIYKIPKQIKVFDSFITDDNLCLVIKKLKNQKDINITNIIKVISELEIPIIDIKTGESSLEDIFLDIFNEKMKSEFKFN